MNSNWKKECNYWHKTNESGRTINIIKVDGIEVEVSDEVYAVYAGIGRKERYARERASKRQLSLERAEEDGLPLFMLAVGIFSPSAESDYIESIGRGYQITCELNMTYRQFCEEWSKPECIKSEIGWQFSGNF